MLIGVGGLAAALRFVGLGEPESLVFDELYYARGAASLLELGYEGNWTGEKQAYAQGDLSGLQTASDRAVHPPLGKWMIAGGIQIFGGIPFGWRFSSALIGTITVLILALTARILLKSTLWGGVAGLFLAIDGQHVVLSRAALLDIFLTFFLVSAFALLVWDRRRSRKKLMAAVAAARARLKLPDDTLLAGFGPRIGIRWFRMAALVALGLGAGVKWSSLYFAAFFMLLSVAWDIIDRRDARIQNWFGSGLVRAALPALLATVTVLPLAYTLTWVPWFASEGSHDRQWAQTHPDEGEQWLPEDLRSWVHYQQATYKFHRTLNSTHTYESRPWSWTIQGRPTAFYYSGVTEDGQAQCGASSCTSAISALGNPLLWWAGSAALLYALFRAYVRRDVLAGSVAFGVLAGWLPWFLYPNRVTFTFYTVAIAPFVMLTLAWASQRIAQPPRLKGGWSRRGGLMVGGFIALALIFAAFFYPLWTGQWIPRDYWSTHMWIAPLPWHIGDLEITSLFGDEKFGWI